MFLEYKNDYLYFVLRSDDRTEDGTLIYCSGVNIDRFRPLTKGRHGRGANPAMRGLQIANSGIRSLAIERGATPKSVQGTDCVGIAPTNDTWFTELIRIENAPAQFPEELIRFGVKDLLRSIVKACMLDEAMPEGLLSPLELQQFLDTMCAQHRLGS